MFGLRILEKGDDKRIEPDSGGIRLNRTKGQIHQGRFIVPYRVYGDGDTAIVCVSGAQQTMAAWRPFITRFSKTYAVVVFDLPGLGGAKILDGEPFVDLDEQVEILHRVVEEGAGERRRIVCGASWGTMVACAYAARYADQVERMILGSFGVRPNSSLRDVIREGQRLHDIGETYRAAHLILQRFGQKVNGAYRKGIIRQFKEMTPEQAMTLYHHCSFVSSCERVEDFIDLEAVRATTLIINGAEDTIIDPEDALIAGDLIPDCRSMIIENSGHFLHFERPDIMEIYEAFIEGRRDEPRLRQPMLATAAAGGA